MRIGQGILAFSLLFMTAASFARPAAANVAPPPPLLVARDEVAAYPLLPHCDAAPGDIGFDRITTGDAPFVPVDRVRNSTWPAVIWVRCTLRNADPRDHRLWLITMGNQVDRVEIYERTAGGYRMSITGMHVPFNQRTDRYYYPAFSLDDDAFSGKPIYMHLVYYQDFPLTMNVRTEHRNFFRIEPFRLIEGIFFGVLLSVALFNLFVFSTMRDRSTLLYVFYVAALIANELVTTGIGDQYLWPNVAGDIRWLNWGTTTAAFGTGLLFTRSFLQTRRNLPGIDAALIAMFFGEAALNLVVVLMPQANALIVPLLLLQLAGLLLGVIAGVLRCRQGYYVARFFVIGFVPATIGFIANLVYDVFAPPGNWFLATNGFELGAIFQSVLISFALLDRIRILDRQKEEVRAELTVVSQEALRLHDLALHDPLTGLANRMLFTEELERALLRANRKGTHVGVLFADLDGFKPINDVYGHRVGDDVLNAVAERLKGALRRADVTARFGGDEFAIIVEDLKSPEQVEQICESLGDLLATPLIVDNTIMPLGISVGASLYPKDGTSVDELLHAADLRMYAVKERHRAGGKSAEI